MIQSGQEIWDAFTAHSSNFTQQTDQIQTKTNQFKNGE